MYKALKISYFNETLIGINFLVSLQQAQNSKAKSL